MTTSPRRQPLALMFTAIVLMPYEEARGLLRSTRAAT
jgi:hypothetical protein